MLARITDSLSSYGLALRGGFNFASDEPAPETGGAPARSLLLIGNIGGDFWPHFARRRSAQPADIANPLDTWTREIVAPIADRHSAVALYPSDKPYQPFQRWAMRAEGLRPSPLGILMHPEFGPWHAYRAALLFTHRLDLPEIQPRDHPCDSCGDKPCTTSCPVDAHAGDSFAYDDCLEWAGGASGQVCRHHGCLDRNACPVGTKYRYSEKVQAFLMRAFLRPVRS